jgi:hypothetical protein
LNPPDQVAEVPSDICQHYRTRRRVYQLATLFSLDSFGGGLCSTPSSRSGSIERFGLDVATTGAIFFATGLCSAASYFAAVPLARRFSRSYSPHGRDSLAGVV